jgi:hypothetical protein
MHLMSRVWPNWLTICIVALYSAACGGPNTPVAPGAADASLHITVAGLPSGGSAAIQVAGPGVSVTLARDTVLRGLAAGTYTVTASAARIAGATYEALRPVRVVTLVHAGTATETFAYAAPANAEVRFTVSGLPTGSSAVVRLLDAGNGERGRATVANGVSLAPMIPGEYRLDVEVVETATQRYRIDASNAVLTLTANTVTAAPAMIFQPRAGTLSVTLTAPTGVTPSARLERPDGSFVATFTPDAPLVHKVEAGSYVLRADTTTAGAVVVAPVESRAPVTIVVGATVTATVAYRLVTPANFNLSLTRLTVSQAIQPVSGVAPPVVAYRRALVRAFAMASGINPAIRPPVQIELFDAAGVYRTVVVPAVIPVPVGPTLDVLGSTWNVELDSAEVRPGMRIRAVLDPARTASEATYADNVWPVVGTQLVDARVVPPLPVTIVPVLSASGQAPMTMAEAEALLEVSRALLPLGTLKVTLREPFVTATALLQTPAAAFDITVKLRAVRLADGVSPRTYYVAVPVGTAGGQASPSNRIALSYIGGFDLAHELGHLFGRDHTPGCVASDEPYPYAGGVTAGWGWRPGATQLEPPTRGDLMGYCAPKWVSDYTWTHVMNYRALNDTGVVFAGPARAAVASENALRETASPKPMLLVFGKVQRGLATVSPAIEVDGVPSAVPVSSPYALSFRNRVGQVVHRVAVAVDVIADADERGGFAAMVPIGGAALEEVTVIVLERNGVEVGRQGRRVATAQSADSGSWRIAKLAGGRRQALWNVAQWPLAVVRDVATRQIVGFLRGGQQVLPGADTRVLEVLLSDGVRTQVRRVP